MHGIDVHACWVHGEVAFGCCHAFLSRVFKQHIYSALTQGSVQNDYCWTGRKCKAFGVWAILLICFFACPFITSYNLYNIIQSLLSKPPLFLCPFIHEPILLTCSFIYMPLCLCISLFTSPFINMPFIQMPILCVSVIIRPFINMPFIYMPFLCLCLWASPFIDIPFFTCPFYAFLALLTSPVINMLLTYIIFGFIQHAFYIHTLFIWFPLSKCLSVNILYVNIYMPHSLSYIIPLSMWSSIYMPFDSHFSLITCPLVCVPSFTCPYINMIFIYMPFLCSSTYMPHN